MLFDGIEFNDRQDLNKYLLFKYLKQGYSSQGATLQQAENAAEQLILSRKDNLFGYHGLAWQLGAVNFEFFNLYFLQDVFIGAGKAELSEFHHQVWAEVQELITGKSGVKRKVYICPRGIGKTTFISQSGAVYSAAYKYKRYIMLCSAIGDTADAFINNIKLVLKDNKRIEQAFGVLYDPKHYTCNNEIIDLANEVRIQSISSASVFRGKNFANIRPELVILDDYQKDDDVATAEQREKKWKRFNDDVMKSIQQNTCTLIACGTIQHKECFYSRLLHDPTWSHRFERGVLVDNVDRLFDTGLWAEFKKKIFNTEIKDSDARLEEAKAFYFSHEKEMQFPVLWPQWWNCLDVALSYYENPVSFKQETQNDVENIGQRRFTTIITEKPKEIETHSFEKTMLCIDPASSTGKENDFTAFVVGSKADTGVKYCRKGEIMRVGFDDYINHAVKLLRQYDEITHIYIEKNLYMGTDVLRLKEKIAEDPQLRSRPFVFINEMQKKNKADKIDSIVGDVLFGRLILNEADKDALRQLSDYQGAQSWHDDFPDCLAEFDIRVDTIETVGTVEFFPRSLLF